MTEKETEIAWINNQICSFGVIREQQELGVLYYDQENKTIMERTKQYWKADEKNSDSGSIVEDPYVSNYKVTSGFMSLLVDQKVNFSINSGMTAEIDGKELGDILHSGWRDDLSEALEDASKKAFTVWQFYLDDAKSVQYKEIPAEQITLVRDGDKELKKVIRQYKTTNDKYEEVEVVELWDSETVTKYIRETGADWTFESSKYHLYETTGYGGVVGERVETERIGKGWERPPFAVLYNNPQMRTDLQPIQSDIDVYDIVKSDWANNLEDFNAMWWVVKNYGGADLKEFQADLKEKHAINLGEDGELDMKTIDIPYEAKKEFIELAKADIFRDGMGVNMSEINGAVTATEIRAMFYNLSMKATKTERMVNSFLKDVLFFYDYKETDDLEVVYNRDMIVDELAIIDSVVKMRGVVSDHTLYSQIPWIDDVDGEIKRMEEQKEKEQKEMINTIAYGDEADDDEESEATVSKA